MEIEERFWSKVDWNKDGSRCWPWMAGTGDGYGVFSLAGSLVLAHRLAYEMEVADIPPRLEIDHRCHNSLCCNPIHLRPATRKQNGENRSGLDRDNKSGVRGVHWDASRSKWRAGVRHNNSYIHAGYFNAITDAEVAVITKRRELFTHNDRDL